MLPWKLHLAGFICGMVTLPGGTMATADLRRIFRDAGRAHAMIAAAVNVRLRHEVGLPLALFEPMAVIAATAGCRVHDLAAELGVSAGGASKLVDRLQAAGHCRRLPNPGDRRSSLLELTATGRRLCAEARQVMDEELERLVGACLPAAEAAQLAAALRHVCEHGGQAPRSP
jgi:MarR family transcriptional regulator, organic hydroperoxide resistance regulator